MFGKTSKPNRRSTKLSSNAIPTEKEWENWRDDVDVKYAHKMFAGKTIEETVPLFEPDVINRVDELRWMPCRPFQYYVMALRDYVVSDDLFTKGWPSDAASCFLNLIHWRLKNTPEVIAPVMHELLPTAQYIAAHQRRYGASIKIYGNFREQLRAILKTYKKVTS